MSRGLQEGADVSRFLAFALAVLPCPGVELRGALEPPLGSQELRLVCGDPDSKPGSAWHSIPASEARFHLTGFLQERGYHHPRFTITDEGRLVVEPGPVTRVTSVTEPGAPARLRLERKRHLVGETLTPRLLGSLEAWANARLEHLGYPCPRASTVADTDTGAVVLRSEPGPLLSFASPAVEEKPIEGVAPGALRRFDAFNPGDLFDGELLTITEDRIASSGAVESEHLLGRCTPDGAVAKEENVPGRARLLTLGFGFNTEGLVVGRASWRNTRLGPQASLLDLTAVGSSKDQEVIGTLDWYFRSGSSFHLEPQITTLHENEDPFEYIVARASVSPAVHWESSYAGWDALAGPSIEQFRTLRGSSPGLTHFLSLEGRVRVLSHTAELYAASPRGGWSLEASVASSDRQLLSSISAQRFGISGEALYNFRDYDPPWLVLGLRGAFSTTVTGEPSGPDGVTPPTFLHYLGGSKSLRGFGRLELPEDGTGGLSSFYLSGEARFSDCLPLGIQPIVFVDVGAIGWRPFDFDDPLYWSPGLGIRWASPFGVFRATAAHGYLDLVPDHWQFYVSFGEEF
jgi:translocation and assembly module TamA